MGERTSRTRATALACALASALVAGGCYRGAARPTGPAALGADRDWVVLAAVPEVLQRGERDCGAAAAEMLLAYWGIAAGQEAIRAASAVPADQALSAGFLRGYLRSRGLEVFLIHGTLTDLERELAAGRPVLVGVVKPYLTADYAHYQVVTGYNRAAGKLAVIDPAVGWREYPLDAFAAEWAGARSLALVAGPPKAGR